MKKLMIAAAIVCAAAVSQAAQIQWFAMGVTGYGVETPYTGAATLTLWDDTVGGSTTYDATMTGGMIMTLVGDASGATAGFIQQDHMYSGQYTMTDTDGNVYTSTRTSGVQGLFPSANTMMFTGGSWAVPEPTSGLLLLLGVAGLALKRKRA